MQKILRKSMNPTRLEARNKFTEIVTACYETSATSDAFYDEINNLESLFDIHICHKNNINVFNEIIECDINENLNYIEFLNYYIFYNVNAVLDFDITTIIGGYEEEEEPLTEPEVPFVAEQNQSQSLCLAL